MDIDNVTALRAERDIVMRLVDACAVRKPVERPVSATYDAATNNMLLSLAVDGLRFRLMRDAATSGEEAIPESFIGEIDARLAAL